MGFTKTFIDYLWVFFGTTFGRGVALLNTIIIARMLGPKLFGIFSIFYAAMLLAWSLPHAFDTVFVAYAKRFDSSHEKTELLKAPIAFKLLYLGLALALSYPLAFLLATYGFQKSETLLPLLAAIFSGAFLTFLVTVASTLQEQEKFGKFAFLHGTYTFSVLICLGILEILPIQSSLAAVIWIYIIVSFVIGAVSFLLLLRRVGSIFHIEKSYLQKTFSWGKWLLGASITFNLFVRIDVLFLTRYLDFETLGIYSVGAQLNMIVALATGSLAGICLPRAGTAIRSKEAFWEFVKQSMYTIVMIEIGIVIYLLLAPFVVDILYGEQYRFASKILRILLWGQFIYTFYVPFSFLFIALGETRTVFLLDALKLLIVLILLYVLTKPYGVEGGAYAVTLSLVAYSVVGLIVLKKRLSRARLVFSST